MAGRFSSKNFTLQDLMSQKGITLEVNNEIPDDEEVCQYDGNAFSMKNNEILKHLNMYDNKEMDENGEVEESVEQLMLSDLKFDKMRKQMTDVLGNGMVMKLVRKEGTGEVVTKGAQVAIKYIGQFEYYDEPFDSSYAHGSGPETFFLGQEGLIPGLEISISTMKKNEISCFLIKPEYAYGKLGCPPRIPPNQTVLFMVYLDYWIDHGDIKNFDKLSIEEKKAFSIAKGKILSLLAAGKTNFKMDRIRQSIREYNKAADMLEEATFANDEEKVEQKKLLTQAFSNLAVCYNKENKPRHTCEVCQKVPHPNAKSLFHFGRALIRLGEYTDAREKLWQAKKLEPFNKQTLREIRLAEDLHMKYKAAEKLLWSNCLQITKEDAARSEFEKTANEICENLKNDTDLVRLPLPDGLTPAEDKVIRDTAASHGLSITNQKRSGKQIFFLSKSNH